MLLFDDFVRTDDSISTDGERLYPFLNRSAWLICDRARTLCEEWFSRYPEDHRRDMRRRFTSSRDEDHRGAYFELLLHEILVRLGATVTVHPKLAATSKRPDFLVELDGARFYLEAMVDHASEDNVVDHPILDTVCHWINQMAIPDYFVHLIFSELPTYAPKKDAIRAQIKRLILLNNGEVTRRELFAAGHHLAATGFLQIGDAHARVHLNPRDREIVGVAEIANVIRSAGSEHHDVAGEWREHLRDKANRKELQRYDLPCVIATDVMDGFARISNHGVQAVFGTAYGPRWQGGLWDNPSTSSWRDTLVGVWMFRYAEPVQESPSGAEDCLLLKPSTEQPLPTRLVQLTHAKAENCALDWFAGLDLDELLEVPPIPYDDLRRSRSSVH